MAYPHSYIDGNLSFMFYLKGLASSPKKFKLCHYSPKLFQTSLSFILLNTKEDSLLKKTNVGNQTDDGIAIDFHMKKKYCGSQWLSLIDWLGVVMAQ